MTYLRASNITVDIPVVDVRRSFRGEFLARYTGGLISCDQKKGRVIVRALSGVTVDLKDGDRLGLIGHNGSGKSTLLRVLAGIYQPTLGMVTCNGLVTPMLNPNVGMDYDETGYENIVNMAKFLGAGLHDMRRKIAEIEELSELGSFLHLPVRTYSSGMQVRLAFAIITSIRPEILIMDEGIGAADAHFTAKADLHLRNLCEQTRIMVLATHSEGMMRCLCNKALLLDHGRAVAIGSVDEVLARYNAQLAPVG